MDEPQLESVYGEEAAEQPATPRTPVERFRDQWAAETGPGFLRQYNLIRKCPDLLPYAGPARIQGWMQPLTFAMLGLALGACLLSAMNWLITHNRGKQADEIAALRADVATESRRLKGIVEAEQAGIERLSRSRRTEGLTVGTSGPTLSKDEAVDKLNALIEDTKKQEAQYKYEAALKEKTLRAAGDAQALARSATPVMLVLALVFCAQFVRRGIQNDYARYRLTRQADDFYLYYAAVSGWWAVAAAVALLHLLLSAHGWGLTAFFEGGGYIIKIVMWLAAAGLLMYTFYLVSMDLYKALLIPAPSLEEIVDNRIFLQINIGFWMVFAVLEIGMLVLCYGVYLLQKSV